MRSRSAPAASAEDGQFGLALELAPEEALPDRLFRLGLPPGTDVTLTRNRTVLVSHHARFGLRLHAGYAWAPDEVLAAIVLFLKPRVPRAERIVARRKFLGFPVDRHVPSRSRLGEFRADHDGRAVEITLSARHVRRDGWPAASETLLHEMVHQWQCETGLPLDHGAAFRAKAREVGISPNARVPAGFTMSTATPGSIE